jgi:hypothetical protein
MSALYCIRSRESPDVADEARNPSGRARIPKTGSDRATAGGPNPGQTLDVSVTGAS